jgi:protein involved in polysaccharide export with SLBB domain
MKIALVVSILLLITGQEELDIEEIKKMFKKEKKEIEEVQKKEKQRKEEEKELLLSPIEKMFVEDYKLKPYEKLKQFGYDIFEILPPKVEELTSPPEDYVLGPGDELIIHIWGKAQDRWVARVDREGKIILPKIGIVYVWGKKFDEAQEVITKKIREHYFNVSIDVSLGKLKEINVSILGDVHHPGRYTVPAFSDVIYALAKAGGPTYVGSMRNIILNKRGKKRRIDLYQLLLYGRLKEEWKLSSGDVIFVPSIEKVVGIRGAIKRPGIYEIKGNEDLWELIKMAGGMMACADKQEIKLERIVKNKKKIINLKERREVKLKDGDMVIVPPIASLKYNWIKIVGNVAREGEYELTKGMKVKELIEKAGGILEGTYMRRIEVKRFDEETTKYKIVGLDLRKVLKDEKENIELKQWDVVTVFKEENFLPKKVVIIKGAVHKSGEYEFLPNMKVEDLIFRAGGIRREGDEERIEIWREKERKIVKINLKKEKNIPIYPGDVVVVHKKREKIELPTVKIEGEVRFPGEYVITKGEKLSSVLKRAGSFTNKAFLRGGILIRKKLRKVEKEIEENFFKQREREILAKLVTEETEEKEIEKMLKYRKQLLKLIGEKEMKGRIIIDFTKLDKEENNIELVNGDSIYIPPIPFSVQVVGCVYNPISIIYKEGKEIDFYLQKAGGVTELGDKDNIYILKPNGEIQRGGKVERGDVIVVPDKEIKPHWVKRVKEITEFTYHTAVSLMSFLVLYLSLKK